MTANWCHLEFGLLPMEWAIIFVYSTWRRSSWVGKTLFINTQFWFRGRIKNKLSTSRRTCVLLWLGHCKNWMALSYLVSILTLSMQNAKKCSNLLWKSCGMNTITFLKYVWPFFNNIHDWVKINSTSIWGFVPKYSRIDHVKHIKYYLKFFKGCLPLVLHYPFLNTSSPYASRIFRIHVTMFSHLKYLFNT